MCSEPNGRLRRPESGSDSRLAGDRQPNRTTEGTTEKTLTAFVVAYVSPLKHPACVGISNCGASQGKESTHGPVHQGVAAGQTAPAPSGHDVSLFVRHETAGHERHAAGQPGRLDLAQPRLPGGYNYRTNPPPADGSKVILSDTDHLGGLGGNPDWVWKSFLRGHHPLFMDPYDNRVLGKSAPDSWNPVRESMGHTRRLAERLDLASLTPREDLASTGHCLADPGRQYVVYLPEGGQVEVDLSAANESLAVEWITPVAGKSHAGKPAAGGGKRSLQAPFRGPAVLLLGKPM